RWEESSISPPDTGRLNRRGGRNRHTWQRPIVAGPTPRQGGGINNRYYDGIVGRGASIFEGFCGSGTFPGFGQLAYLLEIGRPPELAPFEQYVFGRDNRRPAVGHAVEGDFPVEFRATRNGVGRHEDLKAASQEIEDGLQDAHMRFHPRDHDL